VDAANRVGRGSLTAQNFNEIAAEVAKIIFGAPEFHVH
jgi:hypothetical protein